jgi:hypothetical protein
MVNAIRNAGGNARLTKVKGMGHYVWEQACVDDLFDWMGAQRRGHGEQVVQRKDAVNEQLEVKRREVLGGFDAPVKMKLDENARTAAGS